ncbi:MAG: leucine--tRNA ligase [Holosporales bacterium]|jgi:leucyl-tRNA synthetase|nr:leucine--tRNA ligase [Holosporales bacterium]
MSDSIYNFRATEKKWRNVFLEYRISNDELKVNPLKKYYVIEMLPYPSGKIHMGHVRNYVIGDAVARYKKMSGFLVIHPMGWDSFGLPAENAAISEHGHPKPWTEKNIAEMKEQIKPLGNIYDWPREISTCSKEYYSHEQQIFLDLYKKGLIYRKKSHVNWDPVDQTVLANEQVIDGKGWRSGAMIERKVLEQWFVKITDYAEELLNGLQDLEGFWPEKVLKMQKNWIGKSEGVVINFEITDNGGKIPVYTTRPDTIFGASFIAISPNHEISEKLSESNDAIKSFVDECKNIAVSEEVVEKTEKKGIFTGLYAKHPVIDTEKLPIYIANFVLIDYGTGAVFGCPAHDERDFDFASKYALPIKRIIDSVEELPYAGNGKHINSDFLNGLDIDEAKSRIADHFEKLGIGSRKITYRLRDWLVSRQRYWGCPIPIVHCNKCGMVPAELPVILPEDVVFDGKGNPLETHPTWKYIKCPRCGCEAMRDTDTLDTFFESSWYFLRYLDPECKTPINKEISEIAMPVDLCIGGIEHAVLHLLYARFFTLALRDIGYIDTKIPFKSLLTQGMVCHKSYKNSDGDWVYPNEVEKLENGKMVDSNGLEVCEYSFEKMSKSKKNTISPQAIINSHGVDAVRLFILSDTPPEKDLDWNTDALDGSWRFLNRVWKVFNKLLIRFEKNAIGNDHLIKKTHIYLKKITKCYEMISLNKSVALIREFFNEIENSLEIESADSLKFAFEAFIKAICPITPFICHEIWDLLQKSRHIQDEDWPEFDKKLTTTENVTIVVQVNGKLRKTFEIERNSEDLVVKDKALHVLGEAVSVKAVKNIIIVKNKIINFVM